jgi:hypothetical protein
VQRDLARALIEAAEAADNLTGARQARAVELRDVLIGDAMAFARRLAFVVEGDVHLHNDEAQDGR